MHDLTGEGLLSSETPPNELELAQELAALPTNIDVELVARLREAIHADGHTVDGDEHLNLVLGELERILIAHAKEAERRERVHRRGSWLRPDQCGAGEEDRA